MAEAFGKVNVFVLVAGPETAKNPFPVPPCAAVTRALSVKTFALAFGKVKVLAEVAGPATVKNPFAVPPFAVGRIPVTAAVRSTCAQDPTPVPSVVRAYLFVPPEVGHVNDQVPAAAATDWVTVPEVEPESATEPEVPPPEPVVIVPGVEIFPEASMVAVAEGV